jgi:dTDP-4-amino-4,6-dideoxygalactose transaminase
MDKFDIVEKIPALNLLKSLINCNQRLPHELLSQKVKYLHNISPNYFNWGRNALYYLFKSLPFTTIAFPAFTCPTIVEAAEKANKKIILLEVDLNNFNIVEEKIPVGLECLVVVHTFGNPVSIAKIKQKHKQIFIVEDCAHALMARIDNGLAGNLGDAVLFSLYKQTPNINGALLLTKKPIVGAQKQESSFSYFKRLIVKINGYHQFLVNKRRQQYLPEIQPFALNNYKPSPLVLSLFNTGLSYLEKEIVGRRRVATHYDERLKNNKWLVPQKQQGQSSYYTYAVRLAPKVAKLRDRLLISLRNKNIFLARMWHDAPIMQLRFAKYKRLCPNATTLAQTVINLPIYSSYTEQDVDYLLQSIEESIRVLL